MSQQHLPLEEIRMTYCHNLKPSNLVSPCSLKQLHDWNCLRPGTITNLAESFLWALIKKSKQKTGEAGLLIGGELLSDGKVDYSGLVTIGFDKSVLGDFEQLRKVAKDDPHTALAYVGHGGERFYLVVHVDSELEEHSKAARKVGAYYIEQYGLCPSKLGESALTVLNIALDSESWYNPKAAIFRVRELAKPKATQAIPASVAQPSKDESPNTDPLALMEGIRSYLVRKERVESLLEQIDQRKPLLSLAKADRLYYGLGLAKAFAKSGRAFYHRLCQWGYGYEEEGVDKEYDLCLESRGHGKDEESVFVYLEGVVKRLGEVEKGEGVESQVCEGAKMEQGEIICPVESLPQKKDSPSFFPEMPIASQKVNQSAIQEENHAEVVTPFFPRESGSQRGIDLPAGNRAGEIILISLSSGGKTTKWQPQEPEIGFLYRQLQEGLLVRKRSTKIPKKVYPCPIGIVEVAQELAFSTLAGGRSPPVFT